ncbi:MAG: response regulator transcription factor [Propionibacteriaceae bacterium]|nr:response regulator transcription factor [Propionibacteriaceae bacterium]
MNDEERFDCLIVDDERALSESTVEYFTLFGLSAAWVEDAAAAEAFLARHPVGLILLDVNLEGESGFSLCRRLRRRTDVPILFVSARDSDDDILLALGVGGDDYIRKPYALSVLLAKVQAVLRRYGGASGSAPPRSGPARPPAPGQPSPASTAPTTPAALAASAALAAPAAPTAPIASAAPIIPAAPLSDQIDFGPFTVRLDLERVFGPAGEVNLTVLEYRLLACLIGAAGRVVSKRELFTKVWGHAGVSEGALNVHIRRLRSKLGDTEAGPPRWIKTVWGVGYRFDATDRPS